jgi:PAS domain S-box-containing protein
MSGKTNTEPEDVPLESKGDVVRYHNRYALLRCLSKGERDLSMIRDRRVRFRTRQTIVFRVFMSILLLLLTRLSQAQDVERRQSLDSAPISSNSLKTLIVDNYHPYTFANENGAPDGFSVDIVNAVATVMGLELEVRMDTWERARKALDNGEIDLLPMMASSPERQKSFDFSVPHTIAFDAVFVRKGAAGMRSIEDLSNKTVIVMDGDAAHDYVLSRNIDGLKLVLIDSLQDGLRALSSGEADAALMPKLVGLTIVKKLNLTNIEPSPSVIEAYNRPFSFAVKKGNQVLIERLSQGLSIIKTTGRYDDIYKQWFGTLEPTGVPWRTALGYIVGGAAGFALIALALFGWTVSLRKQVALRTASLVAEIWERKRAEETLRESEEKHRGLIENLPQRIFHKDANSRYVSCNDNYANDLGIAAHEIKGKIDFDFHPKELAEKYRADDLRLMESGQTAEIEESYVKSGQELVVQTVKTPLIDAVGNVTGILGIFWDITDRKRAEEALMASEKNYRDIFNAIHDAIIVHDMDTGAILDVNSIMEEMWGYTYEETMRIDLGALSHGEPPYSQRDGENWVRKAATEGPQVFEWLARRKNGELFWLEVKLQRVVIAGQRRILAVDRDITDRKRAEEGLQESTAHLRAVIETIPDLVWLKDPEGVYLACNPRFERFFGATEAEIVGKTDHDFLDKEQADFFRKNDQAAITAGESCVNEEEVAYADDGHKEFIETVKTPMYDSEGKIVGVLGVSRDISDRKQAEEDRISHLRFLEHIERVDHAIRKALDVDQMLSDVLQNTLEILETDRAWLMYPCDPKAESWSVPMERTRPEYPGALALGEEIPMLPGDTELIRQALDTDDVVTVDHQSPGTAQETAAQFGIVVEMQMAIYPRAGKPWMFGVHQCSHHRDWTDSEKNLFREIGHRLGDGLSSLLFLRDLRESEERLRNILDTEPECVKILNPDNTLVTMNPAGLAMIEVESRMALT